MKWSIFGAAKKHVGGETEPVTPQPAAAPPASPAPRSSAFDRVTLPASVGVAWGEAQDSVMRHIQSQRWTVDPENTNDVNVFVRDVDVDGHRGCILAFRFSERRLFGVTIGHTDIAKDRAVDEYRRFKSSLSAKFGPPKDDYFWFEDPYTDGDGRSLEAIQAGKSHIAAYWFLDGGRHGIELKLNRSVHVLVKYEDTEVSDRFNSAPAT